MRVLPPLSRSFTWLPRREITSNTARRKFAMASRAAWVRTLAQTARSNGTVTGASPTWTSLPSKYSANASVASSRASFHGLILTLGSDTNIEALRTNQSPP